jgi:hypothetical protein
MEEKFGSLGTVAMIKNLQMQSDVHSTKILDLFQQHYHVSKMVDEVNAQKKRSERDQLDPR